MRIFTICVTLISAAIMLLFNYSLRPWGDSFFHFEGARGWAAWLTISTLGVGLLTIGAHNIRLALGARRSRFS